MEFLVLLDMDAPEVYAYSIYSVISEKFEAIVSLGDANSRYKYFYDNLLRALLMPIVQSMSTEYEFGERWSFDDKNWK